MHPLLWTVLWIVFAFSLTVVVECGLSLLFRSKQLTYCVFLCNLLTNPLLNLILLLYPSFFGQESYYVVLAVLEIVVVGVEAFVIRLMTGRRLLHALGLSLLFNAASFSVGLLFW